MAKEVLAIVPIALEGRVREAGALAGLVVRVEESASAGITALSAGDFASTIVSLGTKWADVATVERIAGDPRAGIVIVTAETVSLELTVALRRAGASTLLSEPLDAKDLARELGAPDMSASQATVSLARAESGAPALLGNSGPMAAVFAFVARVSDADATVLITGESGTGKELVARAIHWASLRAEEPFVAVNCAAIPEHLLESELFGHERGAFTGAVATKVGRFERAGGGTLFLDEIGDMSLVLQAKVLRAIEEREIERLGGDGTIAVDVRLVAATNRDLRQRIADGAFREDLFFRLAVIELSLPPLRDRGDDIETLALHFASEFSERYDRPVDSITAEAMSRLRAHPWPGNVRELRNVLDRAVLLARGSAIGPDDLQLGEMAPRGSSRGGDTAGGYAPTVPLDEVEAHHIRRVLLHTRGKMSEAARLLGIHRNTLTRKVREYGLADDS